MADGEYGLYDAPFLVYGSGPVHMFWNTLIGVKIRLQQP